MEALQGSGLTIFYSGSVNVFDHVPAHKVQAVMLLLSDDHNRSNPSVLDCTTDSLMQTQQPQLSKTGAVDQDVKASYPPQSQPLARSLTPATDETQFTHFIKKQALTISKRSQAELPFARKASLARFLEKRKDRVLDSMKRNEDMVSSSADGDDVEAFGSPCRRMKL